MFRFGSAAVAAICLAVSFQSSALAPGEIDGSFGGMGKGRTTVSFLPDHALAYASGLAPDGSIYIAGASTLDLMTFEIALARLTKDGEFDAEYGTVEFGMPGYAGAMFDDLVVQPDGKLIGVGIAMNQGGGRWLACRLFPDGSLDETFGDAQTPGCTTPLAGEARAVALQSDGRLVVVGSDDLGDPSRAAMIRLNKNGALDTTFADNQTIALLPEELAASSSFSALVVSPDDSVATTGSYGPNGDQQFMVAKFNADGVLRDEFSQDGVRLVNYALLPPGSRLNISNALAVLADGSVIVSGVVYVPVLNGSLPRIGIVKLQANGELSPDFPSQDFPDGQLLVDPCIGAKEDCQFVSYGMHVREDGRILLAGYAEFTDLSIPTLHTTRLLPNGQLDPTYVGNNNGEFVPGVSLAFWEKFSMSSIEMQGDRVMMVGEYGEGQDKRAFGAMRIAGETLFTDGLESD